MLPPKAPEHKFWPRKVFFTKTLSPTYVCQNDQRDVGIILSHVCWGRTPPPPPPPGTAGRAAPAQTPLPARRPSRGRGGVGQMGFRAIPPPPRKAIFFPPKKPSRSYMSPTFQRCCIHTHLRDLGTQACCSGEPTPPIPTTTNAIICCGGAELEESKWLCNPNRFVSNAGRNESGCIPHAFSTSRGREVWYGVVSSLLGGLLEGKTVAHVSTLGTECSRHTLPQ